MKPIALLAVIALAVSGCDASPNVSGGTVAAAPVPTALAIEFRQVSLPDQIGTEYFTERASHGGRLVVVQYTVKNTSREPIPAYEIPQVRLFDRDGVAYAPDVGLTAALATEPGIVADTKLISDLNPGIMTQGADVFEVSSEAWAAGGWQLGWAGAAVSDLQPIGQ